MSRSKRQTASRSYIAIALAAIVLVGGILFLSRNGQNPAGRSQAATAATETMGDSWYQEVSIQRVADIIADSEHALIYYRSPT